jgi:hypothetical protein
MTEAIRHAPSFIGGRSIELSANGETHITLVCHMVAEDHHCLVDGRLATRDWKFSFWTTILAIVVRATTIPTCTMVVIVWIGNADAVM